jgi:hypothetical protein
MKSLRIKYRDGTEVTIKGEASARQRSEDEIRDTDDEKKSSCKGKKSKGSSDNGLFPAFTRPITPEEARIPRVDSIDAMIDHLDRAKRADGSHGPHTFAIKNPEIDPLTAREIFERMPDGAHVTLLGDYDA